MMSQLDASSDVLFELRDDWHFNPLVYREQIAGEMLNDAERISEQKSTFHYNQVLSNSVFALCPEGAGPNTLRLWEALAVGSIPIVIVEDWLWPEIPDKKLGWDDAVIVIRRDKVDGLIKRLREIRSSQPERLVMMQKAGMALYQHFAQSVCFKLV
jgi:hypothetical protein